MVQVCRYSLSPQQLLLQSAQLLLQALHGSLETLWVLRRILFGLVLFGLLLH